MAEDHQQWKQDALEKLRASDPNVKQRVAERAVNCMLRAGFKGRDPSKIRDEDLLAIPNFGVGCLALVRKAWPVEPVTKEYEVGDLRVWVTSTRNVRGRPVLVSLQIEGRDGVDLMSRSRAINTIPVATLIRANHDEGLLGAVRRVGS